MQLGVYSTVSHTPANAGHATSVAAGRTRWAMEAWQQAVQGELFSSLCVPALNLWQELHLYGSVLPCQSLLREQLAEADRMPQVEGE